MSSLAGEFDLMDLASATVNLVRQSRSEVSGNDEELEIPAFQPSAE